MGTGSFPGVKRPGRDDDQTPLSSAKSEETVQLYLLPLWAFVAYSRVNFTVISATHCSSLVVITRCCISPEHLYIFVISH